MTGIDRGKLKIYIGYAAGVGKTYQMLEEGQNLKSKGVDVVIGYFEPHGRKDTIAKTEGLEFIPRLAVPYRGSVFEEMNTDAILARHPRICLVDEFAHTNIPGALRIKRWEDVEVLQNAGIDILTTMNVQHLESLNDQILQITGIQVKETVPDWVVQQADEVVIVDLSPRALLHRLERGVIYDQEKVERALKNFFRESTLVALRELAMRETAHEIEHRVIKEESDTYSLKPEQERSKQHKILLLVTADPKTAMLIRRARRVSDYLGVECFAVAIHTPVNRGSIGDVNRKAIEKHLNFAHNMRIETRILAGSDVARTLVDFARQNQITQLFLVRPREKLFMQFLNGGLLQKIVRLAKDMQVVIVSERKPERD
jgi:two-component system, OmpR family, sensor histidine kinase KdpD